jgi:ACR3 family arsenite efflux pump ArsB
MLAAVFFPGRGNPVASLGNCFAGFADSHSCVLQLDLGLLAQTGAGGKHSVACPSTLIGASNFFELVVAAAISLFDFQSGAALATFVGILIEVPVMLLVVRVVNPSHSRCVAKQ